jgi:acyl-CoA reductase-like NAD-dependent aldehyde dehydrogenase
MASTSATRPVIQNGRIENVCPRDLHALPAIEVASEAEVQAAISKARAAHRVWSKMSFKDRSSALRDAAKRMLERRHEVVDMMYEESGKFTAEVLMGEALGPLEYVNNWIKEVKPALQRQKLPVNPLAFPGKSGWIDFEPRGVIGIIAPWNFSLGYFFKPVFPALLAGNGVVIKPSEHSPRMGAWFVAAMAEFLPEGLIQCVQGGGEVGQTLVRSGIDGLVFTGSINTGKKVAKTAAEQLIPCSMELGGKDAALVLNDCNLERTVAGVLNWSMHNAGQECGSIERVYVQSEVADKFVEMLTDAVRRLRAEPRADGQVDVGPLGTEQQLDTVNEQVKEAVASGAKLLVGGRPVGHGLWFQPTVLDYCQQSMRIVQEETFGPVITLIRVGSVDQAIEMANDSIYGLCASVWSEDIARATLVCARLEVGTTFINNHGLTGAMAFAPWSGVKQTGYGISNSRYSMPTFIRPKTYFIDKNSAPDFFWYPVDDMLVDIAERLADAQLGKILGAIKVPLLMKKRVERIRAFVRGGKSKESAELNSTQEALR